MSYDTTVHEALDPPQPRLADKDANRPIKHGLLRRALSFWRPLAATTATICTLFFVTWIVATLTLSPNPERTDSAERESDANQQHVVRERGE